MNSRRTKNIKGKEIIMCTVGIKERYDWDLFSVVETAENKGVIKGRAEGRAEERELQLKKQEEERLACIQSFRRIGIADEQIAAGLNLPLDYIKQH